jgi:hypothetical protein
VLALIRIWEYAAMHRCKGIFFDMADEDLLIACRWTEQDGDLIGTLIEVRFLERDEDGVLQIHDWQEHNGFAFFADERSQKARFAAQQRWSKHEAECSEHTAGIAPSPDPVPHPEPTPLPEGIRSGRGSARK